MANITTQSYAEYILMTVYAVIGSETLCGVLYIWPASSVCRGPISWVCMTHSCVSLLWSYAVTGILVVHHVHSNAVAPHYFLARKILLYNTLITLIITQLCLIYNVLHYISWLMRIVWPCACKHVLVYKRESQSKLTMFDNKGLTNTAFSVNHGLI